MFLRSARRRGYDPAVAESIWRGILRFGAFAFCKAHAAGYGVLAYQAGWLKAHYPVEFTVALMNHHAGMYDKRVHLEAAKRRGVGVLLPDVNRSAETFTADGDAIRIGLERVRGLTESARAAVLCERARRPFTGFEDFMGRVPLARPELEALVLCGAFDFSGATRPELLCLAGAAFDTFRARRRAAAALATGELFAADAPARSPWRPPSIPEFDRVQRGWLEWALLGLCAGEHPMRDFRTGGTLPPNTLPARDAEASEGGRVRAAGMVAARRVVPTKDGRPMQFVTLEDETGMIECTLFPPVYARHRGRIRTLGPFVAEGRVETQYGAPTLTVDRIDPVPLPPALAEVDRYARLVPR